MAATRRLVDFGQTHPALYQQLLRLRIPHGTGLFQVAFQLQTEINCNLLVDQATTAALNQTMLLQNRNDCCILKTALQKQPPEVGRKLINRISDSVLHQTLFLLDDEKSCAFEIAAKCQSHIVFQQLLLRLKSLEPKKIISHFFNANQTNLVKSFLIIAFAQSAQNCNLFLELLDPSQQNILFEHCKENIREKDTQHPLRALQDKYQNSDIRSKVIDSLLQPLKEFDKELRDRLAEEKSHDLPKLSLAGIKNGLEHFLKPNPYGFFVKLAAITICIDCKEYTVNKDTARKILDIINKNEKTPELAFAEIMPMVSAVFTAQPDQHTAKGCLESLSS